VSRQSEKKPTIRHLLFVDDERNLRELLKAVLEGTGEFAVTDVGSVMEAEQVLRTTVFDAIILDVKLPDGDGLELLLAVRNINLTVPVLIISGYATLDITNEVTPAFAVSSAPLAGICVLF
jgi:DNA-binding NtrC family response regulator